MGDLRRLALRIDNRDYGEKGNFSDVNMLVWVWLTGSSGRGDVYELVQTTRPEDGRVYDIRSVGSSNNKHILLGTHSIHFC